MLLSLCYVYILSHSNLHVNYFEWNFIQKIIEKVLTLAVHMVIYTQRNKNSRSGDGPDSHTK